MIVAREAGRLRVVLHDEHQRQAAAIARAWGNEQLAPPPAAAVAAIACHDGGWAAWDACPRLDPRSGRPFQFLELADDLPRLHRRGVAGAARVSPDAGLLVSLHACGVLADRYGWDDPGAGAATARRVRELRGVATELRFRAGRARFGAEQRLLRRALRARGAELDAAERWRAYDLLQAWDQLSLALLADAPGERTIGPPPTRGGSAPALPPLRMRRRGPHEATVAPWPFAVRRVELAVRCRRVPDRRYDDGAAFALALAQAPVEELSCALVAAHFPTTIDPTNKEHAWPKDR
ncbi:MAG TPA: DUF3891 family protein [Conexibacter sp.]|nr:DUF3891 family protein [Conexibacter sp.]